MDPTALLECCEAASSAIRRALDVHGDFASPGLRPGQYGADLVADKAGVAVLFDAGLGVLSEESGTTHGERDLLAVLDPLDGSTNASRGVPWYATSICVVDRTGPLVALVVNQANGTRYDAVRNGGARRDGSPIKPSSVTELADAIVGCSGYPTRHFGWRQYRVLGAAALDLCAVADGTLDGFIDCDDEAHGLWDYLGGMLVCREANASVADALGRDLLGTDEKMRRSPVAAASDALLAEILTVRRGEPSQ